MRHHRQEIIGLFRAAFVLTAALAAGLPCSGKAASGATTATAGVAIGGWAIGSTIQNTVIKQDPAVLAAMVKTFADEMAATNEARVQAEAKAEELATKLGFTKAAVTKFFKILGETDVPEENIPVRLGEIASHFAQTRDELAALAPDDPHSAELARSAKSALDAGRLSDADGLLDQAKEAELAAFRQARELRKKELSPNFGDGLKDQAAAWA
jgi:hypothetical protein